MTADDIIRLENYGIPPMDLSRGIEKFVDEAAADRFRSEFFYADSFDPALLAGLFYNGMLPMAIMLPSWNIALTPKLHIDRCVLDFGNLHVERGLKKKLSGMTISIDTSLHEVIRGCLARHGSSWLYPPLLAGFIRLAEKNSYMVRIHSVELRRDGNLIAGEIGCTAGGCYTSLSGFHTINSSGTIQLAALGRLLHKLNFSFWDLGMYMPYKEKLGAEEIPAGEFIRMLRAARDLKPDDFPCGPVSVDELI